MKIEVHKQEDDRWTVLVDGEVKGKNLECVLGVIDNLPVPLLHDEEKDEFLLDDIVDGEDKSRPDLWITIAGVVMSLQGPLADAFDMTKAEVILEGEVKEDEEEEPQIIQFPQPGLIVPE